MGLLVDNRSWRSGDAFSSFLKPMRPSQNSSKVSEIPTCIKRSISHNMNHAHLHIKHDVCFKLKLFLWAVSLWSHLIVLEASLTEHSYLHGGIPIPKIWCSHVSLPFSTQKLHENVCWVPRSQKSNISRGGEALCCPVNVSMCVCASRTQRAWLGCSNSCCLSALCSMGKKGGFPYQTNLISPLPYPSKKLGQVLQGNKWLTFRCELLLKSVLTETSAGIKTSLNYQG